MFEIIKAIILGIVQGITEWLPVSSTGHMMLVNDIWPLKFSNEFVNLFMVVIQLGSIMAVVVLYWHKLWPFAANKSEREKKSIYLLWVKIIIAAFPAALAGLLMDDYIDAKLRNSVVVSIMLIVVGIVFILAENNHQEPHVTTLNKITYKDALIIGLFQIFALIPGTSRSGSTIIGGILIGLSRPVVAEFSFFLAIPMMFGASGLKLLKYIVKGTNVLGLMEVVVLLVGMVVAFLVSVIAIKMFMNYIKKHDFKPFGYYRIVLGIIVLLYFWFRK